MSIHQDTSYLDISFIKQKYPKTFKFFSFLPGAISLFILLAIFGGYSLFFWGGGEYYSRQIIFGIAFFILAYYIWWIIRGFEYILLTFHSAFKLHLFNKVNFKKLLFNNNKKLNNSEKNIKNDLLSDKKPSEIYHWFIIPTYKESFEILDETISSLDKSNFDKEKIAITLAGEERDKENFTSISENLLEKYPNFGYFNYTIHPKDIKGEIIGKGSNIKYSANIEKNKILNYSNTTADNILVTTLDADTNIHAEYPNILTYTYLSTENRKYKSFQPMIFFFNNFWQAPFFSKLISLGNSFWILFNSNKKLGMRNFSTHAQPLDALIELDFRSNETIVEDGHQYRRSLFGFKGFYECVPVYTKVYQDANLESSLFKTAQAQYNQMRRWAHGVEDIPYVLCQWIYNFKILNFGRIFYEFIRLFEGIILWATLHIVLSLGLTFTVIKDIQLSSFISLGNSISIFTNFSFLILIIVILLQIIFLPRYQFKSTLKIIKEGLKFLLFYVWFVGLVLLIFSGLPALHTQIRVMLGKPMKKFNVTKKVRK